MPENRVPYRLGDPLPAGTPPRIDNGFEERVVRDAAGVVGNDVSYHLHPNGLCIIRLAESHALLSDKGSKRASGLRISFAGAAGARPRKGFGPHLSPDAHICRIESDGGTHYPVPAGPASGDLVDANVPMRSEGGLRGAELLQALKTQYLAILSVKNSKGVTGRAVEPEDT